MTISVHKYTKVIFLLLDCDDDGYHERVGISTL